MKQDIVQHHWTEKKIIGGVEVDCPAGGTAFGPGLCVSFQNGPLGRGSDRKEPNGCFVETLISAAIGRLDFYQSSRFNCTANQEALEHLAAALQVLENRTKDRDLRGVEGTHKE